MFSDYRNQYPHVKRQRLNNENISLVPLSDIKTLKKVFLLEINGNSKCNLNKDIKTPSWIKYDMTKTNKAFDLSGGIWSIGINACIISNSFNSWKSILHSELPSSSFIKIGIKFMSKPTEILGIKFFENRLYSKSKIISQINMFLSSIWEKKCHVNTIGCNVVGEIFSLTLFSFYLNKLDNTTHILSISGNSSIAKKSWELFTKTFDAFKKGPYGNIERIEVFISKELSENLGNFQIPPEITNYRSDKDLTEYDKNSTALDIRCGLIMLTPRNYNDDDDAIESLPSNQENNIITKHESPTIKPSVISIYTNIPISDRGNERLINGGVYQLLHQIPIKSFDKNSPSSVQYFPKKITYKNLRQNYKLDTIEILLVDPDTNKLLNINDHFMLNLDFKCH